MVRMSGFYATEKGAPSQAGLGGPVNRDNIGLRNLFGVESNEDTTMPIGSHSVAKRENQKTRYKVFLDGESVFLPKPGSLERNDVAVLIILEDI